MWEHFFICQRIFQFSGIISLIFKYFFRIGGLKFGFHDWLLSFNLYKTGNANDERTTLTQVLYFCFVDEFSGYLFLLPPFVSLRVFFGVLPFSCDFLVLSLAPRLQLFVIAALVSAYLAVISTALPLSDDHLTIDIFRCWDRTSHEISWRLLYSASVNNRRTSKLCSLSAPWRIL